MLVKTLHIGGIDCGPERVYDTFKSSQPDVMYDLNNWIFDYCYANGKTIQQLPPLDDWTHSTEDISFWSIQFPESPWIVWMRAEVVEFK